jgi:hypothetical protein
MPEADEESGGALSVSETSITKTSAPSETLSPTFTDTSLTMPVNGEGTSIVALSDSNEIKGSSAWIESPGFTRTSITGTSLKSPMSGINTCLVSATPLPSFVFYVWYLQ